MLLFSLKLFAYVKSGSQAILASMVDSAVDLIAKIIMFVVEKNMNKHTEKYPVGKRRLEPISVLLISVLMIMSSILVVRESTQSLFSLFDETISNALANLTRIADENTNDNMRQYIATLQQAIAPSEIVFNIWSTMSMVTVILCKFSLWMYCRRYNASPIVKTLSEDHFNDILSTFLSLGAFIISTNETLNPSGKNKGLLCIDQIGAIMVGIYIIYGWIKLAKQEISVLVGKTANDEELSELYRVCIEYKNTSRNYKEYGMTLDKVTAYHNGTNIIAEVDIILDTNTPLAIAHDICLNLQHEIERLSWIERAYVHADDIPEPKDEIAHIK